MKTHCLNISKVFVLAVAAVLASPQVYADRDWHGGHKHEKYHKEKHHGYYSHNRL